MKKINNFFFQLQLAEKDKEISGLTSRLENLSREKVLNSVLQKSFRGVYVSVYVCLVLGLIVFVSGAWFPLKS